MTRREFVKIGAAGIGAAALSGCSAPEEWTLDFSGHHIRYKNAQNLMGTLFGAHDGIMEFYDGNQLVKQIYVKYSPDMDELRPGSQLLLKYIESAENQSYIFDHHSIVRPKGQVITQSNAFSSDENKRAWNMRQTKLEEAIRFWNDAFKGRKLDVMRGNLEKAQW